MPQRAKFFRRRVHRRGGVRADQVVAEFARIRMESEVLRLQLRVFKPLVYGDLSDASSLYQLVKSIRPDETYNLGAQSHVRVSFEIPEYTSDATGLGCVRLLEAIREADVPYRFYQASSSEQYGKVAETPQNERTLSTRGTRIPRAGMQTRSKRAAQTLRSS